MHRFAVEVEGNQIDASPALERAGIRTTAIGYGAVDPGFTAWLDAESAEEARSRLVEALPKGDYTVGDAQQHGGTS